MVDKDAVRQGYEEIAETYSEYRSESSQSMEILDEFLASLSELNRILDAGCGQGAPVLVRLSNVASAYGMDFSRRQLELARETAPEAVLLQGDMTELPFRAEVFDAVIAYWSLIHIPRSEHQTVIDEFARVLASNGRALVLEGANQWTGDNADWLDTGIEMQWSIAGAETTRTQLRNAGFTITASVGLEETLDDADTGSGEDPWRLFSARLDE